MSTDSQFQKILDALSALTDFSVRQEVFNTKIEWKVDNLEKKVDNLEKKVDIIEWKVDNLEKRMTRVEWSLEDIHDYQDQNNLQHNATHRLLMQAFEHISDMRGKKEPWQK